MSFDVCIVNVQRKSEAPQAEQYVLKCNNTLIIINNYLQ